MLSSAPIDRLKRRAKLMAHDGTIPLHAALDRVAGSEGYASWSLLSARAPKPSTPISLLPKLNHGDVLLLGARPGHGKTRLAFRLLLDAARDGRRAVLFSWKMGTRKRPNAFARSTESRAGLVGW